ncbi:kinase-like protein [Sodiomyces alkalinus F11]|uniref:Kinase-like protein n=1 Tax=Sodiomyces alkalinus (strain CBS 110278 / VKM F-3762 / F11) TaxID=1314773 RepID=A0A3N2PLL3_SODAK|nr:kinase-like protein [Sodiomyces alkalinus F11]ROT35421.1 kinase-like protein [Sodiomyces alkalinus F11]
MNIRDKGVLIDIGLTSLVELLPSGDIIKTAWLGRDRDVERREELALESRIYDLLGEHACLVKKKAWDASESTLVLEYMPNGTLKDYLRAYPEVSVETRRRWIEQAAQGVHLLQTLSIIHCDIGPHNFLLDADLNLKISDFSGSSLHASGTNTRPGTRYTGPDSYWTAKRPPTPDDDFFGLGSTIYFIITGTAPFEEIPSHEVDRRYQAREFPELTGIQCADVIAKCWHREIRSAQEVVDMIKTPGRGPSSGTCDSGVISNGLSTGYLWVSTEVLAWPGYRSSRGGGDDDRL